jgi:hypothetical protein
MKLFSSRFASTATITIFCAFLTYGAIFSADATKLEMFKLTQLFPAEAINITDSIIANPLLYEGPVGPVIIVPASNGEISFIDPDTGAMLAEVKLPTPKNQLAQLIATPVLVQNKLVVVYQCLKEGVRDSHRMAVIDLTNQQIDKQFPVLTFNAEQPNANGEGKIKFNAPTAFSHAALKHLLRPPAKLGFVYAGFGNSGDVQPYHGWLFEVDLDAWAKQGVKKAIRSVLLTTPESECPVSMQYGTQEMICGGGIWAPSGLQITDHNGQPELLIPTGNGQLDLARHDYANTLIRVKPGLQFDPQCDANLCENFNPSQPEEACMASCKNLFIPRLATGNKPLKPSNGECDNKTFNECLAWLDYDLGGSSPAVVKLANGQSVAVQPGKDGGVYLLDAEQLGKQYDRLALIDLCGTASDPCKAAWMGMIVTQPVVTYFENQPIVIVATFNPDKSHAAGLIALKITENNGKPKLQRFWQFPNPNTPEALLSFRSHSSQPVITNPGKSKQPVVWVVDINTHGTLYGIRVKDGRLVAKQSLQGAGRPDSAPIVYKDRLILPSVLPQTNQSMLEAYQVNLVE